MRGVLRRPFHALSTAIGQASADRLSLTTGQRLHVYSMCVQRWMQ